MFFCLFFSKCSRSKLELVIWGSMAILGNPCKSNAKSVEIYGKPRKSMHNLWECKVIHVESMQNTLESC